MSRLLLLLLIDSFSLKGRSDGAFFGRFSCSVNSQTGLYAAAAGLSREKCLPDVFREIGQTA
jgi:hypothetical protein